MQNWISTEKELVELCEKLEKEKVIALDTEFLREHTFYPKVALVQVGTRSDVWLIDPLALSKKQMLPFCKVLENPSILKILHAASSDQECFYTAFDTIAAPSFDTACAASLCGYGESIGLAKLLKEELGVEIEKGHSRTDWTKRPLSEHLLKYAFADVKHLVRLYESLKSRLEKHDRYAWSLELSKKFENKALYEPNPDGIVKKLSKSGKLDRRGLAVLGELVRWREERVRKVNVPRKRVADDDVLVDLSRSRPRDLEHLASFRGLNKGEIKSSGQEILNAIARAMSRPESDLPMTERPDIPSTRENRALDVLGFYLKYLAEEMDLSARLLITPENQLKLIRKKTISLEDLVAESILSPTLAEAMGQKLVEFLDGKQALSLKNGSVRVFQSKE